MQTIGLKNKWFDFNEQAAAWNRLIRHRLPGANGPT
jgi:hypothetical protein